MAAIIEVSRRPGLKRGLSRIGIKIDLKARNLQREIATRLLALRNSARHVLESLERPEIFLRSGLMALLGSTI